MATPALARDFKEFLKLLDSNSVEYSLIGGYAVGIYGYIRTTNDLDIWVNISPENAAKIARALREFGFAAAEMTSALFLARNNVVRVGRLLFGLRFSLPFPESSSNRSESFLLLARLRENKPASGRAKDLADLENLPSLK